VVWRAAENRSDLVILDASDIDRGPVAIAKVPRRVPFGFHGNWVNA
jgi:carotenoid cleavage dioxygenase